MFCFHTHLRHLSTKLHNLFTFSADVIKFDCLTAHRARLPYRGATWKWRHIRKSSGNMTLSDELWDAILILLGLGQYIDSSVLSRKASFKKIAGSFAIRVGIQCRRKSVLFILKICIIIFT